MYLRLAALVLFASATFALEPTQLNYTGAVNDFAGVLNPVHRAEIEQYLRRVKEQTKVEVAVVTIRSIEGAVIEDFAIALYRHWGIGKKDTNEGLLLLLAVQERRMRLEVGYGMEPIFPDGYSGSLLRSMRPALRQGGYGPAILEAAHQIGNRIAQAKGVTLDISIPSRREPETESSGGFLPVAIFIAILVMWFIGWRSRGRRGSGYGPSWFPIVLPGGGDWRGHSGGGFGGSDSGDSFGGFGGGDSGGGGASSDW